MIDAISPAAVLGSIRSKIHESARWYMEHGKPHKAQEAVKKLATDAEEVQKKIEMAKPGGRRRAYEKTNNKETGFKVLLTPVYLNKTLLL